MTSLRLPSLFRLLGTRLPHFSTVRKVVCLGSGPESQIASMVQAVRRTFPGVELLLLCDGSPPPLGEDQRVALEPGTSARRALVARVHGWRPDLVAILLNGNWDYWRQWLLGLLLRARGGMLCNENGDAFFARIQDLPRFLRQLAPGRSRSLWSLGLAPLAGLCSRLVGGGVLVLGTLARQLRRRPVDLAATLQAQAPGHWPGGVRPSLPVADTCGTCRFAAGLARGRRALVLGECHRGPAAFRACFAEGVLAEAPVGASEPHAVRSRLPFADGSFGVVALPGGAAPEATAPLAELRRILSPGGVLVAAARCVAEESDPERVRERIGRTFGHVQLFGCNAVSGCLVEDFRADAVRVDSLTAATGRELGGSAELVVVASDAPLPPAAGLLLLETRGNAQAALAQELFRCHEELRAAGRALARHEEADRAGADTHPVPVARRAAGTTAFERLLPALRASAGSCPVCGRLAVFAPWQKNLRESGACRACGAGNRHRQLALVLCLRLQSLRGRRLRSLRELARWRDLRIYHAAAAGALHDQLRGMPGYVASCRHEDLTGLSFGDRVFDLVLTEDVLEHVADPYRAHREVHRVLAPGGRHVFTVPFLEERREDEVRAELRDGRLHHHFGWEMLDRLRALGFTVHVWRPYRPLRGVVGDDALVFEAIRRA